MGLYNGTHDSQTQTAATSTGLTSRVATVETLEDAGQGFRRYAFASVGYGYEQLIVLWYGIDGDAATRRGVTQGVVTQI